MAIAPDETTTRVSLFRTSEDVDDLEEMCLMKMIRDVDGQPCLISHPMLSRVAVITTAFRQLSDFERLASGCRPIVYAGADDILARDHPKEDILECVEEIKDGLHYYAMAMGDVGLYKKYSNKFNVFSSLLAFSILPGRHLYTSDNSYKTDIDYLLPKKRICLQHACTLLQNNLFVCKCSRHILYTNVLDFHIELINILEEIFPPIVYELLGVLSVTGRAIDEEYLNQIMMKLHPGVISVEYSPLCARPNVVT